MAIATAFSRLTGLLRTAALAAALGVTGLADAYNTANTIPNMLLMLVTGGTVTSVLIPMLTTARDSDDARERAAVAGGAIAAVTLVGSVVLALAAPVIISFFAAGRGTDQDGALFSEVSTRWLVLFAPQLVLYGMSIWATAILNSRGRLGLAATASIATNLITIAAVIVYERMGGAGRPSLDTITTGPIMILGIGTTAAVAAMTAIQYWGARRAMGGLPVRFSLRHPVVRQLWSLGRWTFVYVVVNQLGLAVVIAFANSVSGGITAYQWAFAIMQLPYGILAVSILSAVFPRLAAAAKRSDESFKRHVITGFRYSIAVMIPASVTLAALSPEAARAVVGYGAGSGSGSAFVASALVWFAVSLVPFTLFQVLTRSFYALEETRLPALVNIAVNVVFVGSAAMAVALSPPDRSRIQGIVIAYGLSYVAGVTALGALLAKRLPGLLPAVARSVPRIAVASALVGGVLALLDRWWVLDAGPVTDVLRTVILVTVAAALYVAAATALQVQEVTRSVARLRKSLT